MIGQPRPQLAGELVPEQRVDRRVLPELNQHPSNVVRQIHPGNTQLGRRSRFDGVAEIDRRQLARLRLRGRRRIAAGREARLEEAALDEHLQQPVAVTLPLVEVEVSALGDAQEMAHLVLGDPAENRDVDIAYDLGWPATAEIGRGAAAAKRQIIAKFVRLVSIVELSEAEFEMLERLVGDDVSDVGAVTQALREDDLEVGKHALRKGDALGRVRGVRQERRVEQEVCGVARLHAHGVESDGAADRADDFPRQRLHQLRRHDLAR